MKFEVGVEGSYGCPCFRGELHIHIISRMMRVVATDGIIARIANIRHGIWLKTIDEPLLSPSMEPATPLLAETDFSNTNPFFLISFLAEMII